MFLNNRSIGSEHQLVCSVIYINMSLACESQTFVPKMTVMLCRFFVGRLGTKFLVKPQISRIYETEFLNHVNTKFLFLILCLRKDKHVWRVEWLKQSSFELTYYQQLKGIKICVVINSRLNHRDMRWVEQRKSFILEFTTYASAIAGPLIYKVILALRPPEMSTSETIEAKL